MAKKSSASAKNSIDQEERVIGKKLMYVRIEKNMDRKKLAMEAGIEEEELSAYEEGREAIPASVLLVLSFSLGIHPSYFYQAESTASYA